MTMKYMQSEHAELSTHQQTANQLLAVSAVLMQIFQDQWQYLEHVTADNMLKIDTVQKTISIANGLWDIHFALEAPFLQIKSAFPDQSFEKIGSFVLTEIPFFTGYLSLQHPTSIKAKTQVLRQTLVEQIFAWIEGEQRVEHYLANMSEQDAIAIDQLLIQNQYYGHAYLTDYVRYQHVIPLHVELNIKHLCLVNSVQGERFLQVKALIPHYDQLCFSAQHFLPHALLRIMQTQFVASFHLMDIIDHQQDIQMLLQHAIEHPDLLGLTQLVLRGYWQNDDVFAKQNFLNAACPYWDKTQLSFLPVLGYSRSVHWLFKQDQVVVDWISRNMIKPSVVVAITAFSFVDSRAIHPQVILQTLRYFRDISATLLVHECYAYAQKQDWFQHPLNQKYTLLEETGVNSRQKISNSVLYLEEWLDFLHALTAENPQIVKQVFRKQSRIMQAYMLFLQQMSTHIPADLVAFMHPKTHEHREFFLLLKKYQMNAATFRQVFQHPARHFQQRISVFDSYVADYLVDYFQDDRDVAKSVTWAGLFQQADRWHQQLQHQMSLKKLRLSIPVDQWARLSPEMYMYYADWRFEELHQLDRIIHESADFNHCLALSYSQRMFNREYVAFHMTSQQDAHLQLTLGCRYEYDQLILEQLKLPNNRDADSHSLNIATLFIAEFNRMLRQRKTEVLG